MGVDKKITSHNIRHSCATHLLQNGANVRVVQKILGHTRVKSTEVYTRVACEDLKAMMKKCHPRLRMKSCGKKKMRYNTHYVSERE